MRTWRDILRNGMWVQSLIMFVTTAALWVRGRTVVDLIERFYETRTATHASQRWFEIQIGGNALHVRAGKTVHPLTAYPVPAGIVPSQPTWRYTGAHPRSALVLSKRSVLLDLRHIWRTHQVRYAGFSRGGWQVRMPYWLLLILFAVRPAWVMLGKVRSRRWKRRGLCASCGYDLRATPHRCPECGWIVSTRRVWRRA
jgi:hypothetical protein